MEKKVQQIAVRISKAKKQKFREICEAAGAEMSDVLSQMIESFIEDIPETAEGVQ